MKESKVTAAQQREAVVEERIACEVKSMRRAIGYHLTHEAERYQRRAEAVALSVLINPQSDGDRLVREHLVRVETFKAAAAIAGGAL